MAMEVPARRKSSQPEPGVVSPREQLIPVVQSRDGKLAQRLLSHIEFFKSLSMSVRGLRKKCVEDG
jgi:hypothetical protein